MEGAHTLSTMLRGMDQGPDSALQSGAIVGNGCVFTPLTLVQKQGVLPASMVWTGNPAEKLANLPPRMWERSPAARSTEREEKRM